MSLNWDDIVSISNSVITKLSGDDPNDRIYIGRGPILGGLTPIRFQKDKEKLRGTYAPSLISISIDCLEVNENSYIEISGKGNRQIRVRESLESDLEDSTVSIEIEPINVPLVLNDQEKKYVGSWDFGGLDQRVNRKYILRDPGLTINLYSKIEKIDSKYNINLEIRNESNQDRRSILTSYIIKIKLNECSLYIGNNYDDFKRNITEYIETINATSEYDNEKQIITLKPYGTWDQKRKITIEGDKFEDSIYKPLKDDINLKKDSKKIFEYSASIISKSMKEIFSKNEINNYYKYQTYVRNILYELFENTRENRENVAVVVNTPTGSGKTEVNFDAIIAGTLYLKKKNPKRDLGTVAIVCEPIRALTAEQLGRLFEMIAHVNNNLEENEDPITLGFYMGTSGPKGIPPKPNNKITIDKVPVSICPFCNELLDVEFNKENKRLIVLCKKCNKSFDWLSITNEETETLLPNICVATLDKLCYELGGHVSNKALTFIGRKYVRCSCGRIMPLSSGVAKGTRNCKFCKKLLAYEPVQSEFSMIVIDEGHTFNGTLGSNAGLYISTILSHSNQFTETGKLVISTTATIRNPQELMQNLTGVNKVVVFPSKEEYNDFFYESDILHRKFIISCPGATNRHAIPMAVIAVKQAYDNFKNEEYPKRIPQIVFTMRRQQAENLSNYLTQTGLASAFDIEHRAIHGETSKLIVEKVLEEIRNREIDVVFVTLDLIALGIDIPSILIQHFDSFPIDYSKFVQGYGRSARRMNEHGLVFIWLRRMMPAEAYYLENYRDLFLYEEELMPVVPINKWFPTSITNFIPSSTVMYSFADDENASFYNARIAKQKITNPVFRTNLIDFMDNSVLADPIYPEDAGISSEAVVKGVEALVRHVQNYSQKLDWTNNLLENIIVRGIRGTSEDVTIEPEGNRRIMFSSKIEELYRRSGFTTDDLDLEGE
ncbi:helicase-related protein [Thermoproteota archaeon]